MQKDALNNVHISAEQVLITPEELKNQFPLSADDENEIATARNTIANILQGRDHRLLVVCGPCSIHDPDAALDYARRLKTLAADLSDQLYIVMRVYFEKPRTTVGWKGLINDPYMDGSFDVEAGLHIARRLLLDLVGMGLPLATEALDPNSPQYLGDLFSWSAIGARTTESQTHREMASGLSMPVGFKNGTDGSLGTAINAMRAAAMPHRFVGINQAGQVCLLRGELPAMTLIDSVARFIPGVLGHQASAEEDSFADGLLDCPHYTRPEVLEGMEVPPVLLSGNHAEIRRWRLKQSLGRTWLRRPELLESLALTDEQAVLLAEFQREHQARQQDYEGNV